MTRFFEILTIPSSSSLSASAKEVVNQNITGEGITQELLPLVTGLAQNLKSLIRIGLAAALHLVRKHFYLKYLFLHIVPIKKQHVMFTTQNSLLLFFIFCRL
jgi:hypothetical protein